MSKPYHWDTWKFASRCRWCTINYFTIWIGLTLGWLIIDSAFFGWIGGMIVWGIILILHYYEFLDDDDADDDDDDDKPDEPPKPKEWITVKHFSPSVVTKQ